MSLEKTDTLYCADARFYDLDNRAPLKTDIPFYIDFLSNLSIKEPILELAAGTGRITIPLAEAGYKIQALEYSSQMIRQFKIKLDRLPHEITSRIDLFQGDMSDFSLARQFPVILLPARSFQLLLDENKEISCLENVYNHMADNGHFIIDIARFVKDQDSEKNWVSDSVVSDWENVDPEDGSKIRRTHIKKAIDTQKQIIYPEKTYHITFKDNSTQTVVKQAAWKYFFETRIKTLLVSNGFEITREMGDYDGRPLAEGDHFIFICRKKLTK